MGTIIGLVFEKPEETPLSEETPRKLEEMCLTCPVCGKEYKTENGLEKHMAVEHDPAELPAEETSEE